MEWVQSIDTSITLWINSHCHNPFTDFLFPKITLLGSLGLLWIVIIILLLISKKYRRFGIAMAIILCVTWVCSDVILKNAFQRIRPCNAIESLTMLISKPTSFSFPSSHAATSFACAVSLFYVRKTYGMAALFIASLIAFSRVFLMVHYTSDILCGALFGTLSAILLMSLFKKSHFLPLRCKNIF